MCTMPIGNSISVFIQNQAGPKKARKEGNLCPNFQKFLGHRKINSRRLRWPGLRGTPAQISRNSWDIEKIPIPHSDQEY